MKQLFTLIALLALSLPASGQTIKRQFGTTNDPTTLTNIILGIAGQVGGATNGIEKLNGFGTNTTLRVPTFIDGTNSGTFNLNGPDAVLKMGELALTTSATGFSWDWLSGPDQLFSYDVPSDTFSVQEKMLVSEGLTVSSGQDADAIYSTGVGSSNYFQGSLKVDSNVWAFSITSGNFTNSSITSAIPWHDSNGKQNEVVIGNGLTLSAAGVLFANSSNIVDLIPGSNVTITTNAANRAWTIASTGSGSGLTNVTENASMVFVSTNLAVGETSWQLHSIGNDFLLTNTINNASFLFDSNGTFTANSVSLTTLNVQQVNIGSLGITNNLGVTNNLVVHGQITGNGYGITNVPLSSVIAQTNWVTTTPDYSKPWGLLTTNNNFAWLTPINFNTGRTNVDQCVRLVTNSAATLITFTAPAGYTFTGTLNVTNGGVTMVTFTEHPSVVSNLMAVPLK